MIAIMRPALVNRIALVVEALVVVTIIANIAVTFSNAVVRYLTNQDFPWASDVWTILISIITFLGAPAYFRRGSGMAYTALIDQSHGARQQTAARPAGWRSSSASASWRWLPIPRSSPDS